MRICHVITGLQTGGAELMLIKLLRQGHTQFSQQSVVTLTGRGDLADSIEALGIPVLDLAMNRRLPNPYKILKLAHILDQLQPDLVQTWMYHADVIGGLAARRQKIPVVWGIRQSTFDRANTRRSTLWIAALAAKLSHHIPALILCGSNAARKVHADMGYDDSRMSVIANGFELQRFQPDAGQRQTKRTELGIGTGEKVIGLFARFDTQKNHQGFVWAAGLLAEENPNVRFLLCGEDVDQDNGQLQEWLRASGHAERFLLLGRRTDMPALTNALDIQTSASIGEGLPNVVGEAMACGVPCVVTDVGDSAELVGETGIVVPASDVAALKAAWQQLLNESAADFRQRQLAARQRVVEQFDIVGMVERYADCYRKVLHLNTP